MTDAPVETKKPFWQNLWGSQPARLKRNLLMASVMTASFTSGLATGYWISPKQTKPVEPEHATATYAVMQLNAPVTFLHVSNGTVPRDTSAKKLELDAVYTGKHCMQIDSSYTTTGKEVPWAVACGLLPKGATVRQIHNKLLELQKEMLGAFHTDEVLVNSAGKLVAGKDGLYDRINAGFTFTMPKAVVSTDTLATVVQASDSTVTQAANYVTPVSIDTALQKFLLQDYTLPERRELPIRFSPYTPAMPFDSTRTGVRIPLYRITGKR